MLEQHLYDIDLPTFCRLMQRSSTAAVLRTNIRAMLEQNVYDLYSPMLCR